MKKAKLFVTEMKDLKASCLVWWRDTPLALMAQGVSLHQAQGFPVLHICHLQGFLILCAYSIMLSST